MKSLKIYFAGLVVFSMLAGCAQATGQPAVDSQSSLATAAGATLVAGRTNTPRPSVTPIPAPTRRATATDIPNDIPSDIPSVTPGGPTITNAPPSFTPLHPVDANATNGLVTSTPTRFKLMPPTATPTANPLHCSIMTSYPEYGHVFTPRADFVAKWKVQNTGTVMWRGLLLDPDNIWIPDGFPTPIPGQDEESEHGDIVSNFFGGTKMNNLGQSNFFLTFTVYVGDHYNFHVHIIPPKEPGSYNAWWGLRRSNKKDPFCFLPLSIKVVPKIPVP